MTTEFATLDLENNPAWNAELAGYRPIIEQYTERGFTYRGYIPVKFGPTGKTLVIDLVFQKEEHDPE